MHAAQQGGQAADVFQYEFRCLSSMLGPELAFKKPLISFEDVSTDLNGGFYRQVFGARYFGNTTTRSDRKPSTAEHETSPPFVRMVCGLKR